MGNLDGERTGVVALENGMDNTMAFFALTNAISGDSNVDIGGEVIDPLAAILMVMAGRINGFSLNVYEIHTLVLLYITRNAAKGGWLTIIQDLIQRELITTSEFCYFMEVYLEHISVVNNGGAENDDYDDLAECVGDVSRDVGRAVFFPGTALQLHRMMIDEQSEVEGEDKTLFVADRIPLLNDMISRMKRASGDDVFSVDSGDDVVEFLQLGYVVEYETENGNIFRFCFEHTGGRNLIVALLVDGEIDSDDHFLKSLEAGANALLVITNGEEIEI